MPDWIPGSCALSLQIRETLHWSTSGRALYSVVIIIALCSRLVRLHWNTESIFLYSTSRRMWWRQRESSRDLYRWHGFSARRGWRRSNGLVCQKKSRQRHDLIAACESLRGNCLVSDGATEDSGHNLQLDMFRLNLSRNLLEVGAEL